jgi:hypothetical protein
MYSLALIIFVVSEKKAFEHFPIGSNVNLCIAAMGNFFQNSSSLKPLGQLKPNCQGMIIGRSSTKFMFYMSIGNPRWLPPQYSSMLIYVLRWWPQSCRNLFPVCQTIGLADVDNVSDLSNICRIYIFFTTSTELHIILKFPGFQSILFDIQFCIDLFVGNIFSEMKLCNNC